MGTDCPGWASINTQHLRDNSVASSYECPFLSVGECCTSMSTFILGISESRNEGEIKKLFCDLSAQEACKHDVIEKMMGSKIKDSCLKEREDPFVTVRWLIYFLEQGDIRKCFDLYKKALEYPNHGFYFAFHGLYRIRNVLCEKPLRLFNLREKLLFYFRQKCQKSLEKSSLLEPFLEWDLNTISFYLRKSIDKNLGIEEVINLLSFAKKHKCEKLGILISSQRFIENFNERRNSPIDSESPASEECLISFYKHLPDQWKTNHTIIYSTIISFLDDENGNIVCPSRFIGELLETIGNKPEEYTYILVLAYLSFAYCKSRHGQSHKKQKGYAKLDKNEQAIVPLLKEAFHKNVFLNNFFLSSPNRELLEDEISLFDMSHSPGEILKKLSQQKSIYDVFRTSVGIVSAITCEKLPSIQMNNIFALASSLRSCQVLRLFERLCPDLRKEISVVMVFLCRTTPCMVSELFDLLEDDLKDCRDIVELACIRIDNGDLLKFYLDLPQKWREDSAIKQILLARLTKSSLFHWVCESESWDWVDSEEVALEFLGHVVPINELLPTYLQLPRRVCNAGENLLKCVLARLLSEEAGTPQQKKRMEQFWKEFLRGTLLRPTLRIRDLSLIELLIERAPEVNLVGVYVRVTQGIMSQENEEEPKWRWDRVIRVCWAIVDRITCENQEEVLMVLLPVIDGGFFKKECESEEFRIIIEYVLDHLGPTKKAKVIYDCLSDPFKGYLALRLRNRGWILSSPQTSTDKEEGGKIFNEDDIIGLAAPLVRQDPLPSDGLVFAGQVNLPDSGSLPSNEQMGSRTNSQDTTVDQKNLVIQISGLLSSSLDKGKKIEKINSLLRERLTSPSCDKDCTLKQLFEGCSKVYFNELWKSTFPFMSSDEVKKELGLVCLNRLGYVQNQEVLSPFLSGQERGTLTSSENPIPKGLKDKIDQELKKAEFLIRKSRPREVVDNFKGCAEGIQNNLGVILLVLRKLSPNREERTSNKLKKEEGEKYLTEVEAITRGKLEEDIQEIVHSSYQRTINEWNSCSAS